MMTARSVPATTRSSRDCASSDEGRIQQILAVRVADARAGHGPLEGKAGDRDRGRCAEDGRNIGITRPAFMETTVVIT